MNFPFRTLLITTLALATNLSLAASGGLCGKQGVWIQILGAGGSELTRGNAGPSYLVWLDDQARLLVDTAPGSAIRFFESGASFADLDAVVFSHLHADHTADFPSYVLASRFSERTRPLPVLGPDANAQFPNTETFVERLIGREGAYPYLAEFLTYRADGYKISARNIPATGQRRWSRFGTEHIRLAAIPVHHGEVPAVAWRVEVGGQAIVFAGDFSNQKNVMPKFAENADALVVSHAIPESARGEIRQRYALPSQLGLIAKQANVRMLILGHRMSRTRGRETQSREAIEANFQGPLIFANDLECWGL